jgi:hypothetical protein
VNLLNRGQLHPGIFREHAAPPVPPAISVDWERYSTAEQTRSRARNPEKNGVVAFVARDVRAIPGMEVMHEPLRDNRAHSGIHGMSREDRQQPASVRETMVRSRLFELIKVRGWELEPNARP